MKGQKHMINLKHIITISALGLVLAASFANAASDNGMLNSESDQTDRPIVMDSEGNTDIMPVVREALIDGHLIAVKDDDGRLYYNRNVEELPDPELDLETLDTMIIQYEGEIYTNRTVTVDED
jgi:hypothetical protein